MCTSELGHSHRRTGESLGILVTRRISIEGETSAEVLCAEICIFWVLSKRNVAPDLVELKVSWRRHIRQGVNEQMVYTHQRTCEPREPEEDYAITLKEKAVCSMRKR